MLRISKHKSIEYLDILLEWSAKERAINSPKIVSVEDMVDKYVSNAIKYKIWLDRVGSKKDLIEDYVLTKEVKEYYEKPEKNEDEYSEITHFRGAGTVRTIQEDFRLYRKKSSRKNKVYFLKLEFYAIYLGFIGFLEAKEYGFDIKKKENQNSKEKEQENNEENQPKSDKPIPQFSKIKDLASKENLSLEFVKFNSKLADSWFNKGILYKKINKNSKAIDAFKKVIKINPYFAKPWYYIGCLRYKLKQNNKSLYAFKKAIKLNPFCAPSWNGKGVLLNEIDQKSKVALNSYEKAKAINPKYYQSWYNIGLHFENVNKKNNALSAYKEVTSIKPDFAFGWYSYGVLLKEMNRNEEALDAFKKTVKLHYENSIVLNNIGILLAEMEKYKEALYVINRVIELKPNFENAWNNKGIILKEMNNDKEALVAFKKGIEFNSKNYDAWCNIAILLKKMGKDDDSSFAFGKAIKLSPNSTNRIIDKISKLKFDEGDSFSIMKGTVDFQRFKPIL